MDDNTGTVCYSVFLCAGLERMGETMATPTKTLRLDPRLRSEIDRMARRSRRSFSEVTHNLLDEALRMRSCPGIYFADEPAGREAKVAGTGLGVWEVVRDYLAANRDEQALRKAFPQLSAAQTRACLLYHAKFPEEIAVEIAENDALTLNTLESQSPGLVRSA
jgi:uncharacterized protein (DUF433 family)